MLVTEFLVRFKYLILIFLILFSSDSFAQKYPDPKVHKLITQGIDQIINQKYDQAEKTFSILDKDFPDIPLGKIYLSSVKIAQAFDYADEYDKNFIQQNLKEAIKQSEALLKKDKKNSWNIYFAGISEAIMAYFYALDESWLSAFSYGLSAVNYLEDLIEIDSTFYEAYGAVGGYKYWKSKKTNFLHWLPFFSDEREEGIKLIEKEIKHSTYHYYLAVYSLSWIYIDNKNYNDAKELSESAIKKYPESRFFLWALARAYQDIDKRKAISTYQKILNSYKPEEIKNPYNEILLKHLMAQQLELIGETKKALQLCNEILSINNISEFVKNKLGDRIQRVKTLRDRLSSQM